MKARVAAGAVWMLAASTQALLASQPAAPRELPVTRLEGVSPAPVQPAPSSQRPAGAVGLPVTRIEDRAGSAEFDGQRMITLTLAQPLPLRDLLILLVRGTSFSVVADESVGGTFSGELRDLTMREALEAVLFPRSLDYDVRGNLIRVFARAPATRLFAIDYLDVGRSWQRGVRASAAIPGQTPAADLSASVNANRFDELSSGVRSLLSSSGRMHVDRGAGLIQVTDFADRLDQVGIYVEAVHQRATRQVRLDARVFEVTLTDPAASSIDWSAVVERTGGGVSRTAGMMVTDAGALVKAIGQQGTVRTIAAPQIVAMNNEPAVMRVGTQAVYFAASSEIDVAGRTRQTSAPATVMEGVTLTVTAQIAADGVVQLSVSPTIAERSGDARGRNGDVIPVMHVAEADTIVRVQDGATVVVSGFLRQREIDGPGTGVTGFFGARKRHTARSELVILLTPTVVDPGLSGSPAR